MPPSTAWHSQKDIFSELVQHNALVLAEVVSAAMGKTPNTATVALAFNAQRYVSSLFSPSANQQRHITNPTHPAHHPSMRTLGIDLSGCEHNLQSMSM
ncbi:hypothetical protein ColTof4_02001 [Colletotrichum tofieldiae]|nr:hypothetical protein ColTof3_09714 [Colletotrichum tofieldiae]GKT69578.1 hypothetical protein ColTof4_02001 [Colletotrichum tofieldiae]